MDVAVVGAGLGGLAAAIGLHRAGHAITVLERSAAPRETGAGIGILPNGVLALEALAPELGAALRAKATPLDAGAVRDRHGRPLLAVDGERLFRLVGAPLAVVPRQWLHGRLLAALGPDALRTGRRVDRLTADPDGAGMRLDRARFDLVVAADGAHSRLRAGLFPDHPGLRGSGELAARAIAPAAPGRTAIGGELLDRRSGERFGGMPMADGSVYWYATWLRAGPTAPDEPAARLRWLRARRADWHSGVGELLADTDPAAVHVVETAQLARPLPALAVGRVALLGDAAHAMTPDLGQGAGQAFEDAATLTALLTGADADEVPAALARYDALRRPRTTALQRESRRTHRMLTRHGPAALARDLLLRALPGGLVTRAIAARLRYPPPVADQAQRADIGT